jgi:hypothetical protein
MCIIDVGSVAREDVAGAGAGAGATGDVYAIPSICVRRGIGLVTGKGVAELGAISMR